MKVELVSNSKTLQRLALLLNEVEAHFASSGLNFDIHNITSLALSLRSTAGVTYMYNEAYRSVDYVTD